MLRAPAPQLDRVRRRSPLYGSGDFQVAGPVDKAVPPSVGSRIAPSTGRGRNPEPRAPRAAYSPFKPQGQGMDDLRLNGVTLDRLADRRQLLSGLDLLKCEVDATGMLSGMDAFSDAAFGVLTSSKLVDVLDLTKEDPKVVARYGDGKPYQYQYDGAPTWDDDFLIARRLVEVGVRSVTLSFGRWDSHGANFDLVLAITARNSIRHSVP